MTPADGMCERTPGGQPCGNVAMPGDYLCADCEAEILEISRRMIEQGKAHPAILREEDK